jgi:phospholipid/cholesterol/gamma-HCH transport system permease protein
VFKSSIVAGFEWFGELAMFCARVARAMVTPPFEWGELVRQCDEIGSKSLPLVALAGGATGVVLSLQTSDSLTRFGAKSLLPAVIVCSLIKESGPVITALVVSERVAAGIGAEPGSMKVTDQIDAMEAFFGFIIGTIACFQGMRTRGGTEGVGRSATGAWCSRRCL